MMRWFRRHMRHLMAGMAVMLILGWLVAPAIGRLAREAQPAVGAVKDTKITRQALEEAESVLRTMLTLRMLDPSNLFFMQYAQVNERNIVQVLAGSEHGRYLCQIGFSADIEFASQIDKYDVVPIFDGARIIASH